MSSLWASRRIVTTAAVSPASLASAACGDGSDTPQPPMTASDRPATVGLESAGSRAQSTPLAGAGLSAAKLTTARSDGGPQILYNGHPLYRFTGTPKPGDINGRRVTALGAAWSAVSLAGQVVSRPRSKPGGGGIS